MSRRAAVWTPCCSTRPWLGWDCAALPGAAADESSRPPAVPPAPRTCRPPPCGGRAGRGRGERAGDGERGGGGRASGGRP
jgi:hypothetical protein